MSETNKRNGRKPGSTQLSAVNLKDQAVALFLAGELIPDIAKKLNSSERAIYHYVQTARTQLLATKKEHFNEKLALYLDDTMAAISTNAQLLADEDFLRIAEPERIDSISRAYGILSDKCFVLLAGCGINKQRPEDSTAVAG